MREARITFQIRYLDKAAMRHESFTSSFIANQLDQDGKFAYEQLE